MDMKKNVKQQKQQKKELNFDVLNKKQLIAIAGGSGTTSVQDESKGFSSLIR